MNGSSEGGAVNGRDRIIEVLRGREDAVSEDDLCYSLLGLDSPGQPTWEAWLGRQKESQEALYRLYDALDQLVHEGVVGRTYSFEDEFPEVPGLQVGRVYRVWLRTPETAERDRKILRWELKWAVITGGMFSRDAEVLRDAALREPELLREVQSELRRTSIGPDSR
jgi:hypothetical protein